ncbi:hypothetical protein PLANTIT3_60065 [Plantibacter sp. T3]|nr:hypothetical protein PLANTIT3_60065 [Plantibacter sp. T3]
MGARRAATRDPSTHAPQPHHPGRTGARATPRHLRRSGRTLARAGQPGSLRFGHFTLTSQRAPILVRPPWPSVACEQAPDGGWGSRSTARREQHIY